MSRDITLPQLNIAGMIAYLQQRGWEVVFDAQWQDNYRCVKSGSASGLRTALKDQVSTDIEIAFRHFSRREQPCPEHFYAPADGSCHHAHAEPNDDASGY